MWRRCPGARRHCLKVALPFSMVTSGRFALGSHPSFLVFSYSAFFTADAKYDGVCKEPEQRLTRGNLRQGMVYLTHKGGAHQGQVILESSRWL